jgi:hypothetical protein
VALGGAHGDKTLAWPQYPKSRLEIYEHVQL